MRRISNRFFLFSFYISLLYRGEGMVLVRKSLDKNRLKREGCVCTVECFEE